MPAGKIDGGTPIIFEDYAYGVNAMADLYYGPTGVTPDQMALLGSAVSFRSGAAAGYFDGGLRAIPHLAPGSTAVFQVRVWDAGVPLASYEDALALARSGTVPGVYMGSSDLLNIVVPTGITYLYGLQSFALPALEPSTTVLAIVGIATSLLVFRKRLNHSGPKA